MLGLWTLLVSPKRVRKIAVITKASTLMRLHQALVKRKYRLLYGSRRSHRAGPKGPSSELIAAVVEMKRRNPRLGCRKIAEQISNAFGIEINKDVVRRITHPTLPTRTRRRWPFLARRYRTNPG
jgi:putative transposase